jgi:hypothetical protein
VPQRQLQQQVGADVANMLDRGVQPPADRPASLVGGGVDGPLRPLPRLGALRRDEARIGEPPDRPVDDRPGDLPDPAKLSLGRRELRYREAVRRLLAHDGEHRPLRQSHDRR